jgi:hypothetical protein
VEVAQEQTGNGLLRFEYTQKTLARSPQLEWLGAGLSLAESGGGMSDRIPEFGMDLYRGALPAVMATVTSTDAQSASFCPPEDCSVVAAAVGRYEWPEGYLGASTVCATAQSCWSMRAGET